MIDNEDLFKNSEENVNKKSDIVFNLILFNNIFKNIYGSFIFDNLQIEEKNTNLNILSINKKLINV